MEKQGSEKQLAKTVLFHGQRLVNYWSVFFVFAFFSVGLVNAQQQSGGNSNVETQLTVGGRSIHLSCKKALRDLDHGTLECFGNVFMRREGELLTSDYAIFELEKNILTASGNVVYFTSDSVIYGERMAFDLLTNQGTIFEGRVENDKFQLLGQQIQRLSPVHFLIQDGEYTTCRDCPASWKLAGKEIDLTFDGYAFLSRVFIKLNEAPTLYLPYAVLPIKTRRQSGFLFPRFQPASPNGATFVLPFFWAISRSQDATIGAGFYALKGPKAEFEYRYQFAPRFGGQLSLFYLKDRQIEPTNRWAGNYTHLWELPLGIENRISATEVSDRDYLRKIGDLPGRGEPALRSDVAISKSKLNTFIGVQATRFRSNLTRNLDAFDPGVVQRGPSLEARTVDNAVFDNWPIRWGLSTQISRFDRAGDGFDVIEDEKIPENPRRQFRSGDTPLRKATRYSLTPELYFPLRFGGVFDLVPNVQYRSYFYDFDQPNVGVLSRGYLINTVEVGSSLEKIYSNQYKHLIRPSLTYSIIPFSEQGGLHPFSRQLEVRGNQFDDFDIVPISTENTRFFTPLGNSLTYKFLNRIIYKTPEQNFRRVADVSVTQSINFKELQHTDGRRREPFSPVTATAIFDTDRFQSNLEYRFFPYINRSTYSVSGTYVFARYTKRLIQFERLLTLRYASNRVTANSDSIGAALSWSFTDAFSVAGGFSYQFPSTFNQVETPGVLTTTTLGVTYQSPSQCYRISLLASRSVDNPRLALTFNIPLNISGDGFTNLQESAPTTR